MLPVHQVVLEVNFPTNLFFLSSIDTIEFTPSSPAVLTQDPIFSSTMTASSNQTSSTPSLNICMMCVNSPMSFTPHENPHITMQTDFADVKSLASRLIAAIHADEVEKKLLRLIFLF